MVTQCQLAGIARSTVYADKAAVVDDDELMSIALAGRGIHPASVLRQPENGGLARHPRAFREPEARAAADADIGLGGDGAWPQHQQKTPAE